MADAALAERFLALHRPGEPLLIPNPWDVGSLRLLESLGFEAFATTSSGFAATLGRLDGDVTADEALAHAATMAAATERPVSADLENAFADSPEGVAETIRRARATGLAGCSVEDYSRESGLYDAALATERVAAAVEAAGPDLVLTARAENHIRGVDDLDDTIARLSAYAEAGADVLFAPGLTDPDPIGTLVDAVERPISVLAFPDGPTVAELADLGVARVSVGGWFSLAAIATVVDVATRFRDEGTVGPADALAAGREARSTAFG